MRNPILRNVRNVNVLRELTSELCYSATVAGGLRDFRHAALDILQRTIGFDRGMLLNTGAGQAVGIGFDCDETSLTEASQQCPLEFSVDEVRRLAVDHSVTGAEVFSSERQDRLLCFRLLRSSGDRALARAWGEAGSVGGLIVGRAGGARAFAPKERGLIDAVSPVLCLSESLLLRTADIRFEAWLQAHELTPHERRVAQYAVRGLTNGEIAVVTDCSVLTVRNHLAAVFRKVDVSGRTELAFAALGGDVPERRDKRYVEWERRFRSAKCARLATE